MALPLGYYALSGLINFATSFSLGLLILLKNRKAPASRIFAIFSFSVAFWSFFYFLWLIASEKGQAEFLLRTCMIGVLWMPSLFLHFACAFLSIPKKRIVWLNYLFSLFCSPLVYTTLYAGEAKPFLVFPYWATPGVLFHVALLHFGAVVSYAFFLMGRALRSSTGLFKNQVRYVFIGTAIGYVCGATNFFSWYRVPFPPVLNVFISLYVASIAYAITRYRLMDINLAVTRTAVFAGVYVLLLGVPLLAALAWQPQLERILGARWWVWLLITYAALATAAHYANQYFQRRAEDRLLAEQRRYQQLLVVAAEGMLKILDLKKLLRRIVAIMVKYVRLEYAAVYLQEDPGGPFQIQARFGDGVTLPETIPSDDTLIHYLGAAEGPVVTEELKRSTQEGGTRKLTRLSEWLIRMKASVVVPAFLKDTHLLGFLVLGQKLSEQMFTSDDLRTFNALAHQAAIAIQNAHLHRRGVDLGQMATGHQQLAAWGHEMGNVLHIGTIQVGVLKSRLQESPEMLPREKLLEQLGHIEKVLLRGHDVIDDVKEYLRCTEQPGIHAFPLAQFLKEAVEKLRERFKDCPNIKVALDIPDNLPTVEGLSTLSLLPLNLLAIPFWGVSANATGGMITVKALTDAERSHVELVISDDVTDPLRKHVEDSRWPGEGSLFPTRSRHGAFYYFAAKKTVADHGGRLVVLDGTSGEKGTTILAQLPVKYSPPRPEGEEDLLGDAA